MPDPDLIIREAVIEDVDSIMDLEKGSIAHPWVRSEFESLINDSNKICLIIESEGKCVCYVGADIVLDESNIGNIVTAPECRGRGFGTKLMNALLDELKKRGAAKVFLEVEHDNAPALALYEHCGFEKYGRRRDYYGAGRDAVLMSKCID